MTECPFKNYHHTKLWVRWLSLYQNSGAVPLLFGLLWPEDDLSLLVPLGAKLCFCSLWSCMEYSAQPRNTSTLEAQHPCQPALHYHAPNVFHSQLAMYLLNISILVYSAIGNILLMYETLAKVICHVECNNLASNI